LSLRAPRDRCRLRPSIPDFRKSTEYRNTRTSAPAARGSGANGRRRSAHMRIRLWALFLMCSLAAVPADAQETRGNINGTVRDSTGVIPGAAVRVTNVDTSQTQRLVTNGSGYFEAPLLPAG